MHSSHAMDARICPTSSPCGRSIVKQRLATLLMQTGRLDQARPLLEKLSADAPENLQVLETLFRVQAAAKDFAAARTTAETVQKVRPDLAVGHYLGGLVAEAQGQLDAAARAYEQALGIQPEGAEPLAALARLEIGRKQPERAVSRIKAVIDRFPQNFVARNLMGELLVSQGKFAQAIAEFTAATTLSPKWWNPYRGLAIARLGAKDTEGAVGALVEGMQRTEDAPPLATDLAALYERLGRADEAIQVYEGMVARNPTSEPAANNLAMLLASYRSDAASLDRAQQLAEKLAGSTEPSYVNTRGWVKFKRGEVQEALPLLQQAVERSPESAVMRYHLGMAQLRAGDTAAAKASLETAIKSGNNFSGAAEARAALAGIRGNI